MGYEVTIKKEIEIKKEIIANSMNEAIKKAQTEDDDNSLFEMGYRVNNSLISIKDKEAERKNNIIPLRNNAV